MRKHKYTLLFIIALSFANALSAQNGKPGTDTIYIYNTSVNLKSTDSLLPADTIVGGYLPNYEMTYVSSDIVNYLNQIYYFSIATDSLGNLGSVSSTGVFTPLDSIPSVQSDIDTLISWRGLKPVKIFIVVGGWTESKYYQKALTDTNTRANLVANIASFCQSYGVDGVVIDWEAYQNTVVDSLYGFFINDLKTAFTGTSLQISAAISPTHTSLTTAFANTDFIQLMSYGAYFTQNTQVSLSTLQGWVNGWVTAGFNISKIVIGMPAYARTPSDASNLKYRQILNTYNPLPGQDTVTSSGKLYYYNGPTTIKVKTQYAVSNHLRGVMIWELGQDTFPSNPLSLLYSINEVIPVNPQVQSSIPTIQSIDTHSLKIYPNPVKDRVNIEFELDQPSNTSITITDLQGRIVWTSNNFYPKGIQKVTTDLKEYSQGLYILKIYTDTHSYQSKILKL